MLPQYDVFVENYGPGVIENLDLSYEVMREVNPSIIYARLKGLRAVGAVEGLQVLRHDRAGGGPARSR